MDSPARFAIGTGIFQVVGSDDKTIEPWLRPQSITDPKFK